MDLITTVRALKKGNLQRTIEKRLKEFAETGKQGEERWFSELCFCILTANSKARTAISIQDDLGPDGFIECSQGDVSACIRKHKHRFHNNKSRYIIEARQHIPIRKNITEMISKKGVVKTREWIARTIKGIGFKEASHFLRNVGYDGIAILDRHILNLMVEHRYIHRKPLTPKRYLYYEKRYLQLARQATMTAVELDIYMWYLKTGEVLK